MKNGYAERTRVKLFFNINELDSYYGLCRSRNINLLSLFLFLKILQLPDNAHVTLLSKVYTFKQAFNWRFVDLLQISLIGYTKFFYTIHHHMNILRVTLHHHTHIYQKNVDFIRILASRFILKMKTVLKSEHVRN